MMVKLCPCGATTTRRLFAIAAAALVAAGVGAGTRAVVRRRRPRAQRRRVGVGVDEPDNRGGSTTPTRYLALRLVRLSFSAAIKIPIASRADGRCDR
jgi:hypothetical protein